MLDDESVLVLDYLLDSLLVLVLDDELVLVLDYQLVQVLEPE